jgi:hypothetical protein
MKAGGDTGTQAYLTAVDMIISKLDPALGMADLKMLANGQEVPYENEDDEDDGKLALPDEYSVDVFTSTPQASVHGLDTAGRLSENDIVSLWARLFDQYPIGTEVGLWYGVMIGTWPAIPRPVPPMASAVRAMNQANLWDPQTGYANAQQMAENFPNGVLVTSQVLGHTMQVPNNVTAVLESVLAKLHSEGQAANFTNDESKTLCMKRAAMYLEDGTLPRDGYVCPAPGYIPMGPAAAAEQNATE